MLNADNNRKSTLISSARDVAFTVAVYLFFAGFLYRYYYYDYYGIRLGLSGDALYATLVYAYYVIRDSFDWTLPSLHDLGGRGGWIIISALLLLTVLALLSRMSWWTTASKRLRRRASVARRSEAVRRASVIAAAMLAFPALAVLARHAGVMEAEKTRAAASLDYSVNLRLTEDGRKALGADFAALANGNAFTLVAESSDEYYLLQQPSPPEGVKPETLRAGFVRGLLRTVRKEYVSSAEIELPGQD